jgi:hypothetical protein
MGRISKKTVFSLAGSLLFLAWMAVAFGPGQGFGTNNREGDYELEYIILPYESPLGDAETPDAKSPNLDHLFQVLSKRLPRFIEHRGFFSFLRSEPDFHISMLDGERLQIRIAKADCSDAQLAEIKDWLEQRHSIHFRELANRQVHELIIEQALETEGDVLHDEEGCLVAFWVDVKPGTQTDYERMAENWAIVVRRKTATPAETEEGEETLQVLLVCSKDDFDGRHLESVSHGEDPQGMPCINFELTNEGSRLMAQMTTRLQPDHRTGFHGNLGIVIDGRLHSAPAVQSVIRRRGVITGDFTHEEVDALVRELRAGQLPYLLESVEH